VTRAASNQQQVPAQLGHGYIVIGKGTFESLNLSEEEKAYLRTEYLNSGAEGKLFFFRETERVKELLKVDA
jgi:hypothetical protein